MARRYSILVLVAAVILAGISVIRTVEGDDMSPSIMSGDYILVAPTGSLVPGDVITMRDPLDRKKTILRRVMAVGGQSITVAEGHIKVGNRRLRAAAMGDLGDHLVAQETLWAKKPAIGAQWLTRRRAEPISRWSADAVTIPEGEVYVMADDRDGPLDSRWWGSIPIDAALGVVKLRIGEPHTWRSRIEGLAGTPPLGT